MTKYPSDISRAQFNTIKAKLEGARSRTKPRKLELYEVFNAILYIVRTGCQWRALPSDYPDYRSVHYYFRLWSKVPDGVEESILAQVLKKIGRRGAYEKWKKTQDFFLHRGRAERTER